MSGVEVSVWVICGVPLAFQVVTILPARCEVPVLLLNTQYSINAQIPALPGTDQTIVAPDGLIVASDD